MRRAGAVAALVVASVISASARGADAAREAGAPRAIFALVIGVNQAPDRDVPPLQYADDDAARYLDLFRTLGARVYLLSRLDENTRVLHPQAAPRRCLRGARSWSKPPRPWAATWRKQERAA